MRATCPKCGDSFDISDSEILSMAAKINNKRRLKMSGPSHDKAVEAGKKGALKRWENKK